MDDASRDPWLVHLQRVMELSEANEARLSTDDRRAIAHELGITDADLEAAAGAAEDHLQRGRGFGERGMWPNALTELEQAMALDPERVEIVTARAQAHLHRFLDEPTDLDAEQAQRLAHYALQLDPKEPTAFELLERLQDARRQQQRTRTRRVVIGTGLSLGAALSAALLLAQSPAPAEAPDASPTAATAELPAVDGALPTGTLPTGTVPVSPALRADPGCPRGMMLQPGQGCVAPHVIMEPGVGVAGLTIGVSTIDDVIATFGDDAQITRYDGGEAFLLDYSYQADGVYRPDRVANLTRPEEFRFDDGRLASVQVGVYSKALRTPGGLNAFDSTLDDMLAELGEHYVLEHGTVLDVYRYDGLGIEVWINPSTRMVNSFRVIERSR